MQPAHVAIIMDGNGRWAESRSMHRGQGHVEGLRRFGGLYAMPDG